MRMTFDQDVPVHEQISRRIKCHTGRKHMHEPSSRVRNRTAAGARKVKRRAAFEAAHPSWRRAP